MLKYLFIATLKDGTSIAQTHDDVSITNPSKSAFYDIIDKDVEKFYLLDAEGNNYGVDLSDGAFYINGAKIFIHDRNEEILSNFRLIYFRRVKKDFNINYEEIDTQITYLLGWQCNNSEGKNVKRIMEIF